MRAQNALAKVRINSDTYVTYVCIYIYTYTDIHIYIYIHRIYEYTQQGMYVCMLIFR